MPEPTHSHLGRVLLHVCCGPCAIEPVDALSQEADEIVLLYANPNIHPAAEYERRRDTLQAYAESVDATLVEVPYEPSVWLVQVGPLAAQKVERCRACHRLRLGMAADFASQHGFDSLATTLTVSPYQNAEAIREEGENAARHAGVAYIDRDFRDRYRQATERSRALGMYRQNYCGCIMSDLEARRERAARKMRKAGGSPRDASDTRDAREGQLSAD